MRALLVCSALQAVLCRNAAADCTLTSLGLTLLPDLENGTYEDFAGGLYLRGENARPADHEERGRDLAAEIADLPPPIVLLSVGMSNTTQEFQAFLPIADA